MEKENGDEVRSKKLNLQEFLAHSSRSIGGNCGKRQNLDDQPSPNK
jgi:hypothetical protein